jgi:amidase
VPPADLTSISATELARLIRERAVSSVEAVEAHLARIDAVNAGLNAVVQLTADAAREHARRADTALARGDALGPLHGVPFTVKDWIETNDAICAAGFAERKDFVPKRDATVVARMRAAGAIMLGKTNVNDGAPVYGRPNNPYALDRSPGGSSSGEAAIIAAGGSPIGIGSDSGGSVRYPAHCCGVAGLKPTTGRVPLTGHFPRITATADTRTTIGPLARHTEDLALVLRVIGGPDGVDASTIPVPLGDPRDVDLSTLRVAFFTQLADVQPAPETVATTRAAARALDGAVASVEEARPDGIDDAMRITKTYWGRASTHSWREWLPTRDSAMTGTDVERHLWEWDRFRRSMLAFTQRFDVILSPASPWPAPPHGDVAVEAFAYTLPYSLTGWPAAVVRGGTSPEGLPIAVQIAAAPWRDDVALGVAAHLEPALGGWQPPAL